jgi:hypothetical protein
MTLVDEETAIGAARMFIERPVEEWSYREMLEFHNQNSSRGIPF